jgi:undecaprenyl-diphosphatase
VSLLQALVLGIVEGLTEFLPVSSTGHLTFVEGLMGLKTDDASITAFTAVIQVGAILAAIVYFRRDIVRLVVAFVRGLGSRQVRQTFDWRLAIYVIVGTIPIGIVGFLARDLIKGPLRNLWVVAAALVLWSAVIVYAERVASPRRHEEDTTMRDAVVIGLVQCIALVPGVSRSGATISAGLFRGLDRVTATRLSFLLGIPALVAAGAFELKDALHGGVGAAPTLLATVVAFVVAYVSIAWLLRFVVRHSIAVFAGYRVLLGVVIAGLLLADVLQATG